MITLDPHRTTPEDTAYWLSRGPFVEVSRVDAGADEFAVCEHPASATAWARLAARHDQPCAYCSALTGCRCWVWEQDGGPE